MIYLSIVKALVLEKILLQYSCNLYLSHGKIDSAKLFLNKFIFNLQINLFYTHLAEILLKHKLYSMMRQSKP